MSFLNEKISNHASVKTHVHQSSGICGFLPSSSRLLVILHRGIVWVLISREYRRFLGVKEYQLVLWCPCHLIIWLSIIDLQHLSLPLDPLNHSGIRPLCALLAILLDYGYAFLLLALDLLDLLE